MIFISLSNILYDISSLIINRKQQYIFEGDDSSFRFFVFNKKGTIHLTDSWKNLVAKYSTSKFIQSLWKGVNEFFTKYRPYLGKDDVINYIEGTLDKFKTQFADILEEKVLR